MCAHAFSIFPDATCSAPAFKDRGRTRIRRGPDLQIRLVWSVWVGGDSVHEVGPDGWRIPVDRSTKDSVGYFPTQSCNLSHTGRPHWSVGYQNTTQGRVSLHQVPRDVKRWRKRCGTRCENDGCWNSVSPCGVGLVQLGMLECVPVDPMQAMANH